MDEESVLNTVATLRQAETANAWVDLMVGDWQWVSGYVGGMTPHPDGGRLLVGIMSHRREQADMLTYGIGINVDEIRALHVRRES